MATQNLHQKLIEIRKAVPYLQKENQGHGYNYVSSSQVIGALRAAMNDHGVLLVPAMTNATVLERTTAKGANWNLTCIEMEFTWVNTDNPEEKITCPWYAQGYDDMEKGVGKAATYGEKYFLLKFFNIPTDKDDPDAWKGDATKETPPPNASKGDATEPQRRLLFKLALNHFGDAGRGALEGYFDSHENGYSKREASQDIKAMQGGDFTMLEPFLPDVCESPMLDDDIPF
jgi:hypothetical protein